MDLTCENLNRDREFESADRSPRPPSSAVAPAESAESAESALYAPSVLEPLNPKLKGVEPFEAACGDVSE